MTLYTYVQKEVDVDVDCEIEDEEILEYIHEDPKRLEWFREAIGVPIDARAVLDSMKSLDRDRFLAELHRECLLLGITWPHGNSSKEKA